MIEFIEENEQLLLTYSTSYLNDPGFVRSSLYTEDLCVIKKTYSFRKEHVVGEDLNSYDIEDANGEPITFRFAELNDDYYKVIEGVLTDEINVYFHKDCIRSTIFKDYFVAYNNIAVMRCIERIMQEDLYIGDNDDRAMPIDEFELLIKKFPNSYERKMYVNSRISNVLRERFSSINDHEEKYQKYLNKKLSVRVGNLKSIFSDYEQDKYTKILAKLNEMLNNENGYNEDVWQEEIMQIILLIYPKYIRVEKEVEIKIDKKKKILDFLLIDFNSNVDIVEIKRPETNSLMTIGASYRNNHVPLRDLSGTVMQVEKYLYYLNRHAITFEDKFKELNVKIVNPKGIIIMGRDYDLSKTQLFDFEVVRRKYRNIVDIITYDDLLRRLQALINKFKNVSEN